MKRHSLCRAGVLWCTAAASAETAKMNITCCSSRTREKIVVPGASTTSVDASEQTKCCLHY